ncbi:MAG: hypothetical protein F6J93_16475 [Oscillatoria sp. SIO1A7]|nr:hypothetical protein [Oscillatoria sp. SIO1A7]
MIFDWSEYLDLAKELAGEATASAKPEARRRAAIGLAYYAAFILARNHLRDKEGHSIPRTGDAHRYVAEQFKLNPDPAYQSVASSLAKLRLYRLQADYVDRYPGLSGIVNIALRLSEEAIASLKSL